MASTPVKLTDLPSTEQLEKAVNMLLDRRRETGTQLLAAASQLRDASQRVEELTTAYTQAYRDATTNAWTKDELGAQGLPCPTKTRTPKTASGRRRRQSPPPTNGHTED